MDDLISRQALLESIERISVKGNVLDDDWIYRFIQEFPSAQTVDKDINVPINDIISRQAAIKAICDDGTWLESQGCTEITMAERKQRDADILGALPSAQRKGKWIYLNGLDAFECSVCGRQMVRNIFDYCPWCGAEMTKGEEDE